MATPRVVSVNRIFPRAVGGAVEVRDIETVNEPKGDINVNVIHVENLIIQSSILGVMRAPLPNITQTRTKAQLRTIHNRFFNSPPTYSRVHDGMVALFDKGEILAFLELDDTYKLSQIAGQFNSFDKAQILNANFRVWFKNALVGGQSALVGPSFGLIYYHPDPSTSMCNCCFVDNDENLWIVENESRATLTAPDPTWQVVDFYI